MKRFQERHALEADGVIGPDTIAALNVSMATRVRQIESHGCIRLEDPARLPQWVLRDDPQWT